MVGHDSIEPNAALLFPSQNTSTRPLIPWRSACNTTVNAAKSISRAKR